AKVWTQLGPHRTANKDRMQSRPSIVMEARDSQLGGANKAARLRHLLEQDHASPGLEQVGSPDEGIVTGAHEHDVSVPWQRGKTLPADRRVCSRTIHHGSPAKKLRPETARPGPRRTALPQGPHRQYFPLSSPGSGPSRFPRGWTGGSATIDCPPV